MNQDGRPIDRAMDQERTEKQTVRMFWLEEARDYASRYPEDEEPLYLTLSGAEGRDVRLFTEHELINLTETGAIETKDQGRIIAVESSGQAVLRLQRQYKGLKIVEKDFRSLVRGDEYFNWPEGKERRYCRARIVNLDLNSGLRAKQQEGRIDFPIIAWIDKVATLHTAAPKRDWSLCLTLHGEINWNNEVCDFAQEFLRDNFRYEPTFAESCRNLFGEALCEGIEGEASVDFSDLGVESQQQVLMVIVPKLISQRVQNQGWRMVTKRNLRYGGDETAPMSTWIMRFTWDASVMPAPNIAHSDALAGIFHFVGSIRDDGQIEEDG